MPVKLLSFDLDDTLWPCLPVILRAENVLFDWMAVNVPAIADAHTLESLRQHRSAFIDDNPHIAHNLTEVRLQSMRDLSARHDHHDDWVEQAFEVFYNARQQVELYGEVNDVLDSLSHKYRLAAMSNGNANVDLTGLGHWMELSVNPEEAGVAKPDPDIFHMRLQRAGVAADEVVHIGDHPRHDILGANNAGIASVWVNREGREWDYPDFKPDREIRSLLELENCIASIDSRPAPG